MGTRVWACEGGSRSNRHICRKNTLMHRLYAKLQIYEECRLSIYRMYIVIRYNVYIVMRGIICWVTVVGVWRVLTRPAWLGVLRLDERLPSLKSGTNKRSEEQGRGLIGRFMRDAQGCSSTPALALCVFIASKTATMTADTDWRACCHCWLWASSAPCTPFPPGGCLACAPD